MLGYLKATFDTDETMSSFPLMFFLIVAPPRIGTGERRFPGGVIQYQKGGLHQQFYLFIVLTVNSLCQY